MRVFVALELPEQTKDNIARSQMEMSHFANGGNFVARENLHVTLHFLGEVAESDLIYVQSAMDSIKNLPAPTLAISQFAVLRTNDIICAKFRKSTELQTLHDALGKALEQNRFSVERRAYRPHVTVVRKYNFSLPFSEVTKSVTVFNKPFVAPKVTLFCSTLTKQGATTLSQCAPFRSDLAFSMSFPGQSCCLGWSV